eukprot:gene23701-28726_t
MSNMLHKGGHVQLCEVARLNIVVRNISRSPIDAIKLSTKLQVVKRRGNTRDKTGLHTLEAHALGCKACTLGCFASGDRGKGNGGVAEEIYLDAATEKEYVYGDIQGKDCGVNGEANGSGDPSLEEICCVVCD